MPKVYYKTAYRVRLCNLHWIQAEDTAVLTPDAAINSGMRCESRLLSGSVAVRQPAIGLSNDDYAAVAGVLGRFVADYWHEQGETDAASA